MFNYFLNVLLFSWLISCAFSQSDILCSKNEVPWKEAMTYCLVARRQPMSFHGITGLSIENINLRSDVTVWTSDYFYLDKPDGFPCLCSFDYLTQESFFNESDELFSYCDDFKYFLCRNKISGFMEVLNNTFDYTERCGLFSYNNELKTILKPGYYWRSKTNKCGFDGIATWLSRPDWNTHDILCGAYSKDAGRHFRRCDTSHKHICVKSGGGLKSDLFDDSCFKDTVSSVSVSRTYSSTLHTAFYSTLAGYKTELSPILTRTIQHTSETQLINNSTLGHARGSAHEHGDPDTDVAMIAGIVVGVCLASAGVVVLFIFVRRRCLHQSRSPDYVNGQVSRNEHDTENASFDTIAEAISIGVSDTSDSEQYSNSAKRSENIYNKVEILCNAPEHYYSTLVVKKFVK